VPSIKLFRNRCYGELEKFQIIDWQAKTNAIDNYIICRFADSADENAPSNMVCKVSRFGIAAVIKYNDGFFDTCEFRRRTNVVESFKLLELELDTAPRIQK
jgi:hypothetical protein